MSTILERVNERKNATNSKYNEQEQSNLINQ